MTTTIKTDQELLTSYVLDYYRARRAADVEIGDDGAVTVWVAGEGSQVAAGADQSEGRIFAGWEADLVAAAREANREAAWREIEKRKGDLRTEAAIWAEGSNYSAEEIYDRYCEWALAQAYEGCELYMIDDLPTFAEQVLKIANV